MRILTIALLAGATVASGAALLHRRSSPAAENRNGNTFDAAEAGSVSGTVTFSAARPKQPIIVWLQRDGGEVDSPKPATLKIRQKGAQFNPAFAVVVIGQEVEFVNDEDKEIDHNVYTLGAEQKDFDIFAQGKSVKYAFTKTGEVSLYCSVHKLMDGKLFVTPSSAWAEVGEDGSFKVSGVAAGSYTVRTYQKAKRFRDAETKLVVTAGQNSTVTLELKR